MTKPADVTMFPKKCAHGVPMMLRRRFSGATYYEPGDCDLCRAEEDARMEQADAEIDAMCERIRARKNEEQ